MGNLLVLMLAEMPSEHAILIGAALLGLALMLKRQRG
jgi:hypothetical protein